VVTPSHWVLTGVRLSAAPLAEIAAACAGASPEAGDPVIVACANLHCLVVAARDAEFAAALNSATYVTADGAPLIVAGRLRGEAVGERITGSDVFAAVMASLNGSAGRAMFVGSTPAVLARIRARAATDYPSISVETLSPPFGELTAEGDRAIIVAVNAFQPHVLWVGMTAPKQEKWVARNARELRTGAAVSIGAVFDFYAGTVPRAPAWMQRAGLEWLFRLLREPRRLWRRYLVSGPVFVALLIRERSIGRQL
jgi:N-acetylglucosaminyldiphosphoundecaprenol N-acetyl-beta-D-mannosaminyltransferase